MPRQGLTTETVVGAAALLTEEIGCENLTLHKLAKRLNIKPASLYTHISGIEQLYVLLCELALKQLGTAMMDAVRGKKRGEAIRQINRKLSSSPDIITVSCMALFLWSELAFLMIRSQLMKVCIS